MINDVLPEAEESTQASPGRIEHQNSDAINRTDSKLYDKPIAATEQSRYIPKKNHDSKQQNKKSNVAKQKQIRNIRFYVLS